MKRLATFWVTLFLLALAVGAQAAEPIYITFPIDPALPADNPNQAMAMNIVDEFNKTHKDIQIKAIPTVNAEKMTMLVGTGDAPDIMNPADPFINTGVLLDLGPYVKRDNFEVWKDFRGEAQEWFKPFTTKIKTLQVLPNGAGTIQFYINQTMFDNNGLPYPQKGWTWDDMLHYMNKMNYDTNGDGKLDKWGYAWQADWAMTQFLTMALARGTAKDILDPDKNFKFGLTEGSVFEDLQFAADTVLKHGALLNGQGPWTNGNVGMYMDYDSRIQRMFAAKDEGLSAQNAKFRMVYMPRHPAGETYTMGWGGIIGINARTKHPKEAWEVLKFYVTKGEEWKARYWMYPGNMKSILNAARSGDLQRYVGIPSSWNIMDVMKPIFDPPSRVVCAPNYPGWDSALWDLIYPAWQGTINENKSLRVQMESVKSAVEAKVRETAAVWFK